MIRKKNKLFISMLCVILMAVAQTGCSTSAEGAAPTGTGTVSGSNTSVSSADIKELDLVNMFSSSDKEVGYDENESVLIKLQDNTAITDSAAVQVNGSTITITEEGTYILEGSLSNGQIIVEAEKTDKLQLVLNGVTIHSDTSAPIYIKQADKVFLTLADGTENTLNNNGEFVAIDENNIDAVIFSKEDLTLNGEGTLSIASEYGHGIVSKDDLGITSGTYEINVARHGLVGKDCVKIAYGNFSITSLQDGIHSENADDLSLGYIYIAGGIFEIDAQTDGIDGGSIVQIDGGDFILTTGGGSQNASFDETGNQNSNWGRWGEQEQATDTETDTISAKAVKADGNIEINGGNFVIDSSDDSIHANNNVYINAGIFMLSSGDDGIHADTEVVIHGGTLTITKSYEGIEGQSIDIAGGEITVTASDDGLNAAGGNDGSGMGNRPGKGDFTADANCYIKISGGILNINANGDGVDSNGNLYVTGGETYVAGPENSGNGALDYNGAAEISGGIFVAAGQSGMAQNFGENSTQGSMLVNCQSGQSGTVTLVDSTGKELVSFTSEKQFSSVIISSPELKTGETYTLTMGNETQSVQMDRLIYGSGGGQPNGMGKDRPGKR